MRCNATSSKTLTVSPNGNAGIISGNSPLCPGQITQYSTTGEAGGTWSSTNTNVATVDASGVVRSINPGSTVIKYTVGCNAIASKPLSVIASANAGTVSGQSPLAIGETATYTSNGDAGGAWSSTDTTVAKVNETTGVVTAITAGSTDIVYTVGCNISSFKTLTVTSMSASSALNASRNVKEDDIPVYPNPVTSRTMNVLFENKRAGTYSVQLINKVGQTVHTEKVNISGIKDVKQIHLSSIIASGGYQLIITSPEGVRVVKQIVIK